MISSHHESELAEREASPMALEIAAGRPPLETASSVLFAFISPSAPPTIRPKGSIQRKSRYASPPASTVAATRWLRSTARRETAIETCRSPASFSLAPRPSIGRGRRRRLLVSAACRL